MYGDEVGRNISMKGDSTMEGSCCQRRKGSTRNEEFTMICLESFSGENVICIIIIGGTLPNGVINLGIDITIELDGKSIDEDFIMNCGPEKYYLVKVKCLY